jgi:translation initiation factor 2 beta subunit (eIF-2beta)/eIF-5
MPGPNRPNRGYQKRSWNTKEWKEKQSARVEGQVCQQCGSTDVRQVHHRNTDKKLYYTMYKLVVKQLIKEKMQAGEIPFKGTITREFHCPNCAQMIKISNMRYQFKTCPTCGKKSSINEGNLIIQREYNNNLSRSETLLFIRRYEQEIDTNMKAKRAPPKPDYMNLEQDTVVLCKTCHYALENGHDLCPICKKNYKKIGEPRCFTCLPDEEKRKIT